MVPIDLLNYLFVPVWLQRRLLHLARNLLLKRFLHREITTGTRLLSIPGPGLEAPQLFVELEVQKSELFGL